MSSSSFSVGTSVEARSFSQTFRLTNGFRAHLNIIKPMCHSTGSSDDFTLLGCVFFFFLSFSHGSCCLTFMVRGFSWRFCFKDLICVKCFLSLAPTLFRV